MLKASILNALRKGTDISIKFDPSQIILVPHKRVRKPGGVIELEAQPPRSPQTFSIAPVSATLSGITGAGGGAIQTEGASGHSWSYTLTGRHDAEIEIGDTWKDGETTYRVTGLQPFNGYEKIAVVEAMGKDPKYGT